MKKLSHKEDEQRAHRPQLVRQRQDLNPEPHAALTLSLETLHLNPSSATGWTKSRFLNLSQPQLPVLEGGVVVIIPTRQAVVGIKWYDVPRRDWYAVGAQCMLTALPGLAWGKMPQSGDPIS